MNRPDPRYESIPDFLTAETSWDLVARFERVDNFILETGQCDGAPSHATVQWGPRQSYVPCVPKPYRVKSSGDIPDFLMPLKQRLEKKYNCYFDSIQVNKHFNHNSLVRGHTDSPPGHICMVSVGAERDFKLSHIGSYKPIATIHLYNGSLLSFFPKEQWRMHHAMPRSKTPCGARYGIIFRYITDALTRDGAIGKTRTPEEKAARKRTVAEKNAEYEAAQAAYRSGGYPAVEECLQRRPWLIA